MEAISKIRLLLDRIGIEWWGGITEFGPACKYFVNTMKIW